MVFRSMVRDGTEFYDPLGLISEGTKIDFNYEANSYLYGTRFMTWLARTYSPEKVVAVDTRQEDSRAYYASDFRARLRPADGHGLGQLGARRAHVPAGRTSRPSASIRSRHTRT